MSDFFQIVAFYFNTGWVFLTSFNLPGVNFTPLAALFFGSFVVVVLKFLKTLIGRGGGVVRSVSKSVSSSVDSK